jgi:hypothetical protein
MAFWKYPGALLRAASVLRFHKNRPPQVVLIGLGVYPTRACETGLRVGRKRDRDSADHSLGDLNLQDQHIAQVAIMGALNSMKRSGRRAGPSGRASRSTYHLF